MACSESKTHSSAMCGVYKLFSSVIALAVASTIESASEETWTSRTKVVHKRYDQTSVTSRDTSSRVRRRLMRKEQELFALEVEFASGSLDEVSQGGLAFGRNSSAVEDEHLLNFQLECTPYFKGDINQKARLCSTDVPLSNCGEVEPRQACCECGGGAQFRRYQDTQCLSDDGLSPSTEAHPNPLDFVSPGDSRVVSACMEQCFDMGEKCDAFTVINSDSDAGFEGKCYFRRGRLQYTPNYLALKHSGSVAAQGVPPTSEETNGEDTASTDTRLPFCDDQAAFENIECTKNIHEARPNIHPQHEVKKTQDDVYDNRDCYVKHIYWQ